MTIPSSDRVNRHVFYPTMYEPRFLEALDPVGTFMFSKDDKSGLRTECLIWSRFASDYEIHELGFKHQRSKLEKGKDCRYDGFIWALADKINTINWSGFGFILEHDSSEGMQHIVIGFRTPVGRDIDKEKQIRSHLRKQLLDAFSREVIPPGVSLPGMAS